MLEKTLVLEDAQSQLRVVDFSVSYGFSYISVLSDQQILSCDEIFAKCKGEPSIIIVDFFNYSEKYIHLLRNIRANKPLIPMIALISFGDRLLRQTLYKMGVSEVLYKPIEMDELMHRINVQFAVQRMSDLIQRLERRENGRVLFSDMVGYSAPLKGVVTKAQQLAGQKQILIEGLRGTGKTLLARAIHGSVCSDQLFLHLDCEQGVKQWGGVMPLPAELAKHGGTLFIREVRFLSVAMQQQLLSWIRNYECSQSAMTLICSSSMGLNSVTKDNQFDAELSWLLCKNTITVPSLADRREDIAQLAQHFLMMHTARNNNFIKRFSDDASRMLANAPWPGNVAQLSNFVYRCSMLCNHDVIDAGTLRLVQQLEPVHYARQAHVVPDGMPSILDEKGKIKKLKSIEEEAIHYVLSHYDGSMSKAAATLGIGRSTLYRRMTGKEFQMQRENQTTRPMMRMASTDFS